MGRKPTYAELEVISCHLMSAGLGVYCHEWLRVYPHEELNIQSTMEIVIRDEHDSWVASIAHKLPALPGGGS
jgi:hypothetical protein